MRLKSLSITALLAVTGMGCSMEKGKDFLYSVGQSSACQHQIENDPHERLKGAECERKPSYEDYERARREELDGKRTDGKESGNRER